MEKQEPHSDQISSPGGSEPPHPRTGPGQGGPRIDTAAKEKQVEEGNKPGIAETVKHAAESKVKHQDGQGTAGDQMSGQAPAEGEQRPSSPVRHQTDREAVKSQEPMANSMAPGVEDPAIGNAPHKRLPGMIQIAEFWKSYDTLADIEDKRLSKNLNANLDVLLIFAALFSAVNTTFISMTMPSLSPDPLDRTNALLELLVKRVDNSTLTASDLTPPFSPQSSSITINFLLYASLCCSLLAAMGGMLGKEWLQSFDRSGQTGPLEEQGRLRQRKLNGIEQWHLEGMILFLPNLLLFSVTLFFAGLALYLFPINKVVAGLLIAVLSLSVGIWLVTVLAGAIWTLCPYQSAASRALQLIGLRVPAYWAQVRRLGGLKASLTWPIVKATALATLSRWKASFIRVLSMGPPSTAAQHSKTRKEEIGNERKAKEKQISNAQAAFWLIKTTSSWEDRVAAAEFITTFGDVGCMSVLQDQGYWRRLLQLTQEAFESWHYQPSSANRKIVESFGRASSHLGILRPENAIKWRFRAEEKPAQLRHLFEGFMEGLGIASKRMSDEVTDWELVTYATSLYALEATRDIYTRSRSWERLFILMGDFHFSLLNRQITHAFWNAAHALRSLPESHPETSAFEMYSTFLQEIRHVATTDQLPGELASLLTYSVVEFIFDFNELFGINPGSANLKLFKFSAEALLSLRSILPCCPFPTSSLQDRYREFRGRISWQSPKRAWEAGSLDDFWRALDSIITKLTKSTPEIEELTVDFVLAAVEWLSISLPSGERMAGLERFPQIPTFIALSLAEGSPPRQARGLDLFFLIFKDWMRYSPLSLDRVWNEVGLGPKLVRMVKEPQTWGQDAQILGLIEYAVNHTLHWSMELVSEGFILAAADAILYIDKTREQLHAEWRDLLGRTLGITLKAWDDTKWGVERNKWQAPEMIHMIRHSSVHMERSLNSKEEESDDVLRFVQLIYHFHKQGPLSAFIYCNADVTIRSMFCELQRRVEAENHADSDGDSDEADLWHSGMGGNLREANRISQRFNWNYLSYGLAEAPMLCSRPGFVDTNWL